MRAFLAIPFSPDEHKMLESLQVSLATMPALDDFRWARPENIHITLRFLGDIEEEQAEAAAEALRRVGEGAPAFDISIDRFGVFPNLKRPNVLWTGPSETPILWRNSRRIFPVIWLRRGFPPGRDISARI